MKISNFFQNSESAPYQYACCEKCFNAQGDTIQLTDRNDTTLSKNIRKSEFIQLINNRREPEPFVDCVDCGRAHHQICVLHHDAISPGGFVCKKCLQTRGEHRDESKHNAEHLPRTKLDEYLEKRVSKFLQEHKIESDKVHIRVLSNSQKIAQINSKAHGDITELPYKSKAIFAFQTIDGHDVCFFGMYVQEYGSECAMPNTRRIYIAYLDSVHFFEPKQYRTNVYHEILLGYLDYAKQLGYTMAHIWASPPLNGEDYIFDCHPPDQKVPEPERLQVWYANLFDKGKSEDIILSCNNIVEYVIEEKLTSAAELPYFEGDCLPSLLDRVGQGKRNLSKTSRQKGTEWRKRFCNVMDKHKNAFFVVRLRSSESFARLPVSFDQFFFF